MIIEATFIGKDGSLGYKREEKYILVLPNSLLVISTIEGMTIYREIDGKGYCSYKSIYIFLQNWDNIKRVKK